MSWNCLDNKLSTKFQFIARLFDSHLNLTQSIRRSANVNFVRILLNKNQIFYKSFVGFKSHPIKLLSKLKHFYFNPDLNDIDILELSKARHVPVWPFTVESDENWFPGATNISKIISTNIASCKNNFFGAYAGG